MQHLSEAEDKSLLFDGSTVPGVPSLVGHACQSKHHFLASRLVYDTVNLNL